jgi:hypothetical protein
LKNGNNKFELLTFEQYFFLSKLKHFFLQLQFIQLQEQEKKKEQQEEEELKRQKEEEERKQVQQIQQPVLDQLVLYSQPSFL